MKKSTIAFNIAISYFIVSFAWVLFSDKVILMLSKNIEVITTIQTLKGWFYISLSSIFIFVVVKMILKKEEKTKEELKKTLNSLASPIMVYNENGEILMINKTFEKLTGYEIKEIDTISKWTTKAYGEKALETKQKIESFYNIEDIIDIGTYEITTKNLELIHWHFNIAPFGIKDSKKTIIATALDITELKEKEKMMMQQSKMAAMGEILENIAHQWRQPLSAISTASTGIKLQNDHGLLTQEALKESMTLINKSAQHLSKTIDDFRGFFKPNQKKEYFSINHTFEKIIIILGNKFDADKIKFIKDIEDFKILNYDNALIQVFINIFSNAKDAFKDNDVDEKLIFIDVFNDEYNATIQIKDNAGGIPSKIINKIFEPYFTTKHKSQGTGIGLYMTRDIITNLLSGSIIVENKEFTYKNINYIGAEFTIILDIK